MALTQLKTGAIADDAVTTDKLANAINTERTANTAKVSLTDNSVTLAKMAGGTDGQIITYDASGDPVAVGPGTDGQVLTSTGAGSPPAFEAIPASGISNVVEDTTPQLGGDLYSNDKSIRIVDSTDAAENRLKIGTSADLEIYHNGSHTYFTNSVGNLNIGTNGELGIYGGADYGEVMAKFVNDGAVELYNNNSKTAWTHGSGFNIKGGNTSDQTELIITGNEGQAASILMSADDGDDNADHWRMYSNADNSFTLTNYTAGSYETNIKAVGDGAVELYYDNSKKLATTSDGVQISHTGDCQLQLLADSGDSGGNNWPHIDFRVDNTSGSAEARIAYRQDNSVLKFDIAGSEKVGVNANGLVFNGDTAAGNALNDYEEGDWTPNDLGGSAYNVASGAVGKYVKVGAVVHAWAQFGTDTTGAVAVGDKINVGDLPFNANGINNPRVNVSINYSSGQYSTVAVSHVTSSNEISFTVSQTTGHNRNGSGYYVHVTYWTDS